MCAIIGGLCLGLSRFWIYRFGLFLESFVNLLKDIILSNADVQFGLFGICDGHGGVAAATSASKLVFHIQLVEFDFPWGD